MSCITPYIIQILPRLAEGGAEQSAVDIAHALTQINMKNIVVSGGGNLTRILERFGCPHFTFPELARRNPIDFYRSYRFFDKLFSRYPPLLVHPRSRLPAWLVALLQRTHHFPWITTWHGTHYGQFPLKKFYNSVLLRSDLCIVASDKLKERILHHYPVTESKLRVVARGIDTHYFDPHRFAPIGKKQIENHLRLNLQTDTRKKTIIFLLPGRIAQVKGQFFALKALKCFNDNNPHQTWHCLFVGSEKDPHALETKKLKHYAHTLGLTSSVHFLGHCHNMAWLYALADLVLIPSQRAEPFGRTIAEAQAMEKPVLTLHPPLGNSYFKNGVTGFSCLANSPVSFAQKMQQILAYSPKQRATLVKQARQTILQHYATPTMQYQTLKAYDDVMARHGKKLALSKSFEKLITTHPKKS